MNLQELMEELEVLLTKAEDSIAEGNLEQAAAQIAEAKIKIRPIGTGTLGPRPK